jgi:putative phage-type endonuclease
MAEKATKKRRVKKTEVVFSPIPNCITEPLPSTPCHEKSEEAVVQTAPESAGFMLGFPPDLFRDHGTYFELTFPQRSAEWLDARKKRITASIFGCAMGCSPYKTRTQLLHEMAGIVQPAEFAYFQRKAMENGTRLEPYVRDWYEVQYKKKVVERGLVIPKWNTRIGVSVDGYIINPDDGKPRQKGILEIKCPTNMYPELVDHSYRLKMGESFSPLYYEHIKPEHYAQMQGGMAILDVDYCDYIVYVSKNNDYYPERVLRNRDYWEKELYPKLVSFIAEMDDLVAKKDG